MGTHVKTLIYDTHNFERAILQETATKYSVDVNFVSTRLTCTTAGLAKGYDCVCAFANDVIDAECIAMLKDCGVKLIALRTAGFNQVDLKAAAASNLTVVRVPEYSPYSVAEHAMALILTLNRKTHKAYNRVRELNFSLDGLVGFDLHGKTIGVIGTGRIGSAFAKIALGFGCKVLGMDLNPNHDLTQSSNFKYCSLPELLGQSDIVSLHVPLSSKTFHLIDHNAFEQMRNGAMVINTSRGGLINTKALINALKSGKISAAGLDVYEEEASVFFQDHSQDLLQDDVLARLLTFPNVLITSHQGFLTQEALHAIAHTTFQNIIAFDRGENLKNIVRFS